ncbi:MAG: hypothetical protein ACHQ4J_12370 [Candidatus Binatia bacterium]
MTTTEIQNLLTALMRGIDKKTVLTFESRADSANPTITVHLSRDKRSGSLEISVDDLAAGQTDLMRRNRLRTALKRARDRMWEEPRHIFSTKVEHQRSDNTWFRPTQGGRGRR